MDNNYVTLDALESLLSTIEDARCTDEQIATRVYLQQLLIDMRENEDGDGRILWLLYYEPE